MAIAHPSIKIPVAVNDLEREAIREQRRLLFTFLEK